MQLLQSCFCMKWFLELLGGFYTYFSEYFRFQNAYILIISHLKKFDKIFKFRGIFSWESTFQWGYNVCFVCGWWRHLKLKQIMGKNVLFFLQEKLWLIFDYGWQSLMSKMSRGKLIVECFPFLYPALHCLLALDTMFMLPHFRLKFLRTSSKINL